MIGTIRDLLTFNDSDWYETLPFVSGFLFILISLIAATLKQRASILTPNRLAYVFGEGMSVATIATYAPALVIDKAFAQTIAQKNGKILVIALTIAFITIVRHLVHIWIDQPADE